MNNKRTTAFPIPTNSSFPTLQTGLTKREYFAAAALAGLLQRVRLDAPSDQAIVAQLAVEIADETLTQLEKGGANG